MMLSKKIIENTVGGQVVWFFDMFGRHMGFSEVYTITEIKKTWMTF